jgi:hypothetical protein
MAQVASTALLCWRDTQCSFFFAALANSMLKKKKHWLCFGLCTPKSSRRMSWSSSSLVTLRTRTGETLDDWLSSVRDSHIRELQGFVRSIQRDKAAVLAGLTLPHSNGIVEGKVNKLKLIKRMGYGRAGFPLLRQRVLHAL